LFTRNFLRLYFFRILYKFFLEFLAADNELGLPFKPHVVNAIAKEIDASIFAHSPLEYRLRRITLNKPDYSELVVKQHIPMSRIQLDPRLRRYSKTSTTSSSSTTSVKKDTPPPAAPTSSPRYVLNKTENPSSPYPRALY
jgi:hypothetical protein